MDIRLSLNSSGIGNQLMRLRNNMMFCLYYGIQDLVVNENTIVITYSSCQRFQRYPLSSRYCRILVCVVGLQNPS